MFKTTDVVERLLLLCEAIKRYESVTDPLLIYDLDLPYHGSSSATTNIYILVIIVGVIIFSAMKKFI